MKLLQYIYPSTRLLIICAVIFFGGLVSAQPNLSREQSLETMDELADSVRMSINGNPEFVNHVLIWDMARPAGGDPRVLATCIYLIDHSTNTQNVQTAAEALEVVAGKRPRAERPQIIAVLKRALNHDNLQLRSVVVGELIRLGDSPAARQAIKATLKDYRGKIPDSEIVQRMPGLADVPEGLQVISDVIEKSTASDAIAAAIGSLGESIHRRGKDTSPDGPGTAIRLLRLILLRNDLPLLVRTRAADALEEAGFELREEAYRANLDMLKNPGNMSDSTGNYIYTQLIRKILNMHRPDSTDVLREAIHAHHDVIAKEYERSTANQNKSSKYSHMMTKELEEIEALANRSGN